jgi:hypothetical protein
MAAGRAITRKGRRAVTKTSGIKIPNTRKFLDFNPKSVVSSVHPASMRGAYRDRHDT